MIFCLNYNENLQGINDCQTPVGCQCLVVLFEWPLKQCSCQNMLQYTQQYSIMVIKGKCVLSTVETFEDLFLAKLEIFNSINLKCLLHGIVFRVLSSTAVYSKNSQEQILNIMPRTNITKVFLHFITSGVCLYL